MTTTAHVRTVSDCIEDAALFTTTVDYFVESAKLAKTDDARSYCLRTAARFSRKVAGFLEEAAEISKSNIREFEFYAIMVSAPES